MKISPRPSGVTVFPDCKVYYFEGWGRGDRADEFVRRVRATGRKATMACHDTVNYTMVTVREGRADV